MEKILILADLAEKGEEAKRIATEIQESPHHQLPETNAIAFTIEEILNLEDTKENLLGISTFETPQKKKNNNNQLSRIYSSQITKPKLQVPSYHHHLLQQQRAFSFFQQMQVLQVI